jgi:tubulin polyglutamylase TTLL9
MSDHGSSKKASDGKQDDTSNAPSSSSSSRRADKKNMRRSVSYDYREPSKRAKNRNQEVQIRFRTSFRNTVYDVMKKRGWKYTDSDLDWDIHWAERDWINEYFDHIHLEHWQRVNHYRNCRELCRKDLLIKNVKRRQRQCQREKRYDEAAKYDFCPTTYVLPGDYALFVEEFKKYSGVPWIMKPIGKAQGRGIFMFTKLKDIAKWKTEFRWKPENNEVESYVVQRYIANPYLVGGKKFDMRIYALVTNYQPLKVYLYRRGFARFSAARYSNSFGSSDIANSYMHLTNVAIQKHGDNYNSETGGKWDLRQLKLHLISRHGIQTVDKMFYECQMIIIHSLLSVQPVMMNDKHCFELYGYDIMFDDEYKPWLIEVNASPSLTANTKHDYKLKFDMLNDMFDIIDIEKRLTGDEEQVGGFDLIYTNNTVLVDRQCMYSTFLGCALPPRRSASQLRAKQRAKAAAEKTAKDKASKGKKGAGGRRDSSKMVPGRPKVGRGVSRPGPNRSRRNSSSSKDKRNQKGDEEEE